MGASQQQRGDWGVTGTAALVARRQDAEPRLLRVRGQDMQDEASQISMWAKATLLIGHSEPAQYLEACPNRPTWARLPFRLSVALSSG
ncbi:hypothetical protein GCM10008957_34840 [Deinococcus ruber]|uniref:Uncharacterized protein n=1 Tax=Deinococcus ruber TaxID=1848197 RepID=A0A918CEC9_9DEIO|nr:hypothetical protein GCM10008957_34840 [Deinococcus ruber]